MKRTRTKNKSSLRRTDRKPGDNPKYSEHDTENMQNTMTLKRNKKEKKQEKEKAQLDHHSRKDYMKTTASSQYSEHETENMQKSMNLKRKKKENKLAKERQTNKGKREAEEFCAEHQPQPKVDDEVLSNGSPCDCPAHVHDRESPLKVAEVRFYTRFVIYSVFLILVLNFGKFCACYTHRACL